LAIFTTGISSLHIILKVYSRIARSGKRERDWSDEVSKSSRMERAEGRGFRGLEGKKGVSLKGGVLNIFLGLSHFFGPERGGKN